MTELSDVGQLVAWVCTDCYFAHHYGVTDHEGQWFAGESDTAADREPLAKLEGYELADNTDSETGESMDEFSWRSCDGCGSTLGGSRHRLALFHKGHYSRLGGTYWCDTCDSPYCELA